MLSIFLSNNVWAQVGVPPGAMGLYNELRNARTAEQKAAIEMKAAAMSVGLSSALPMNLHPAHAKYHPHATRDCDLLHPGSGKFDFAGHMEALLQDAAACPICNPPLKSVNQRPDNSIQQHLPGSGAPVPRSSANNPPFTLMNEKLESLVGQQPDTGVPTLRSPADKPPFKAISEKLDNLISLKAGTDTAHSHLSAGEADQVASIFPGQGQYVQDSRNWIDTMLNLDSQWGNNGVFSGSLPGNKSERVLVGGAGSGYVAPQPITNENQSEGTAQRDAFDELMGAYGNPNLVAAREEQAPVVRAPFPAASDPGRFDPGARAAEPMMKRLREVDFANNRIPMDPGEGGRSIGVASLKPGDIIVSADHSDRSKFIRTATGGEVSHAMLVTWVSPDGTSARIIEAVGEGAKEKDIQLSVKSSNLAVGLRRENLSDDQRQAIVTEARRIIKEKPQYDLGGAIEAGSGGWIPLGSEGKVFCSELVAMAYKQANVPLFMVRSSDQILPADLERKAKEGELQYVGHLKAPMR